LSSPATRLSDLKPHLTPPPWTALHKDTSVLNHSSIRRTAIKAYPFLLFSRHQVHFLAYPSTLAALSTDLRSLRRSGSFPACSTGFPLPSTFFFFRLLPDSSHTFEVSFRLRLFWESLTGVTSYPGSSVIARAFVCLGGKKVVKVFSLWMFPQDLSIHFPLPTQSDTSLHSRPQLLRVGGTLYVILKPGAGGQFA